MKTTYMKAYILLNGDEYAYLCWYLNIDVDMLDKCLL